MFFTLCITEEKEKFSYLKDYFRQPEIIVEKISFSGCAPFYAIKAKRHRGAVPWGEISRVAGRLSSRGIFSSELEIPEGASVERYCPEALPLRILFNSSLDIIKKLGTDCLKSSVTVFDENGYLTDLIEKLVFLCANIQIITSCTDIYEKTGRYLFEKYGVSPVITACGGREILKSTYIITPSCAELSAFFKGVVFTLENKRGLWTSVVFPKEISLPEKYRQYLPSGTDALCFASALYELCGIKELSDLKFKG